jgi:hypothetical protein
MTWQLVDKIKGSDGSAGETGPTGPAGAASTVPGATGPAGPTAVSTDAGNLAVLGTDSKILVDAAHVTPAAIGALQPAALASGTITARTGALDLQALVTASHAAVSLDTNADTLLSLTGQALGLDPQAAATVFAGPATGTAAVPTMRALAATDIPSLTASYATAAEGSLAASAVQPAAFASPPAIGGTAPAAGAFTALTSLSLNLAGAISAEWTTGGVGLKTTARTLTYTGAAGTVAAAYTNVLGGNTIAAANTTTFTNYGTLYIAEPVAGTNVTLTNKYSLILGGGFKAAGNIELGPFSVGITHLGSLSGAQTISLTGGIATLTATAAVAITNTLPAGAIEGQVYSRELWITGAYAISFTATNCDTTYDVGGVSPTFTPASGEFIPVEIRAWKISTTVYRRITVGAPFKAVSL